MPTKTHGLSRTPIYGIWSGMLQRCNNSKSKAFKYYGGRGIKVCRHWLNFKNFADDMHPRPEGLTLDRINNNGNYEPSNCRWATRVEQSNNTRTNRRWKYGNKMISVREMINLSGQNKNTISARLNLLGWSVENAISLPLNSVTKTCKGRNSGAKHGMSKLTDSKVIKIREMFKLGATQESISRKFNVSAANISNVVNRKTWAHI